MRLRKPSVDHNELERRQVELMELARVLKDQEGTMPTPATIHANLLTALQVQQDVVTASKWLSEAESISKEIAGFNPTSLPANGSLRRLTNLHLLYMW